MMDDAVPGGGLVDLAAPARPKRLRAMQALGFTLLMLIWLAAAAVLIRASVRAVAGPMFVGGFAEKLLAVDEVSSDINLLFIGSSRTFRHVDPSLLHRVGRAQGCELRAHNLGMSALSTNEINYVLRWMARRDISLPWVVIESKGADALRDIGSNRLYEHLRPVSLPLLYQANEELKDGDGRVSNLRALAASHLNIGLFHRYEDNEAIHIDEREFGRFGFRSLTWMAPGNGRVRERAGELANKLERSPKYIENKLRRRTAEEEALIPKLAKLNLKAGAKVATKRVTFLSPPGNPYAVSWSGYLDMKAPNLERAPYHLALDLKKTPQLLEADYWWDLGHLNEAGAAIYTRYLATELCALEKAEAAGQSAP